MQTNTSSLGWGMAGRNCHSDCVRFGEAVRFRKMAKAVLIGAGMLGAGLAAEQLELRHRGAEWLVVKTADNEIAKAEWYCGPDVPAAECSPATPPSGAG